MQLLPSDLTSLIGSIAGIAGLIMTILTMINTRKIISAVETAKIKEKYPAKHKTYVQSIKSEIQKIYDAQLSIKEGANKQYVITDLLKTCMNIQHFYDGWKKAEKKKIDKLTEYLKTIPCDKGISNTDSDKILKMLYDIFAILERIGELNGIR